MIRVRESIHYIQAAILENPLKGLSSGRFEKFGVVEEVYRYVNF